MTSRLERARISLLRLNCPHALLVLSFLLCCTLAMPYSLADAGNPSGFPYHEKLHYRIEWRLITAGTADVELAPISSRTWETKIKLESAGVVTRLYEVHDDYGVRADEKFCAATSTLKALEGKRSRYTTLNFDPTRKKVHYEERDLVTNHVSSHELDIPACTHEIAGALAALRTLTVEPGKSIQLPITDGKRFAMARIEAQEKETIVVDGKSYPTIRYEAYIFDNVIYSRKGRLNLWLTDDAERLPVQMRIRLGFPIYNINLYLEKQEKIGS
ncbi:MAG: DUF3108 domain-containing protein [Bryobacteraceae bacterium]